MYRLESLTIHAYRNLPKGAELRFAEGINVLLGTNGTGKTTLLNLIDMIVRSDFSELANEDGPVDFEYVSTKTYETDTGVDEVYRTYLRLRRLKSEEESQHTTDRRHPGPAWHVSGSFSENDPSRPDLAFEYGSSGDPHFRPPFPESAKGGREPPNPLAPDFQGALALFFWSKSREIQESDIENWAEQLDLPMHAVARTDGGGRFDEGLQTFRAYTDALRGDIGVPAPSEWTDQPARSSQFTSIPEWVIIEMDKTSEDSVIGLWSEDPPSTDTSVLAAIASTLNLASIRARPKLLEQTPTRTTYRGWDFFLTFKNGSTYHHSALSFGQKRMLAYIWYCGCNPASPLIADELVNGFHYDWIEGCLDLVGERQAFFASQNPLLVDFLAFDSPAEVQRTFVLCGADAEQSAWTWKNMTETDAQAFHRAYEVGIQHVSAILRSKGLW